MIITSTVTGKNQITIPAAVANKLGIEPGMKVQWQVVEDENAATIRPLLSRGELARQLQGKWKHLFPPDSDPIGDLIRERVEEDFD